VTDAWTIALSAIKTRSPKETFEAMREGWANTPMLPEMLALLVVTIAVLLAAGYIYNRRQGQAAEASPLRLFDELAAELAIAPADRRLLVRISRTRKLPTPLTLLLSPRTLRHHAAAFWQPMSAWRKARCAKRIAKLRRQLCAPGR